jgi:LemA protein
MKRGLMIFLGVVAVLVIGCFMVFGSYVSARNTMVAKDQFIKNAWAEIDVDLQRRIDLIPNLVETVKGYTKEEQTVLTNIAQARSGLLQAQTPGEKAAANDRLNVSILPLMRLQEAYPELKSNEQFMRLQDELAGTENRIAVARKRYNDALTDYNIFIKQFPNNIWANISGYRENDAFFQSSAAAKEAPKVDFSH